ncbi:dynamin-1-like protein [Bolinopsis microptera]|uniref:dynamin-1-like protein n=1 Tax=Bolinopsis microptera TaxID=2820187 RepID=UPI003079B2FF
MLLSHFADSLTKSIEGKYTYTVLRPDPNASPPKRKIPTGSKLKTVNEVALIPETTSAGAELFNVFQEDCTNRLSMIPADKNLENLKKVIKSTSGVQPALFIPDGVFNTLITKQLDMFDRPSENAITKSHQCIAEAIDMVAAKAMIRYPKLEREVINISKDFLSKQSRDAKEFMAEYLEVEKSYINTNHPEFIERYQVAAALFAEPDKQEEKQKQKQNTNLFGTYHQPATKENVLDKLMTKYKRGEDASSEERANKEAELMEKLLIHYFCIVRAHLVDMIPKIVMKFFVRKLATNLNSILIKSLYTEEKINDLVQESDRVTKSEKLHLR